MKNMMFDMPVRLFRFGVEVNPDHADGAEAQAWNLGRAILHLLARNDHAREQYKIETEYGWIDHLAAQRLAESSLFERWRASKMER